MSKPSSYPFLNIAKSFGIPYDDVLAVADGLTRECRAKYIETITPVIFILIAKAVDEQEMIRRGVIDWLTGEDTRLT